MTTNKTIFGAGGSGDDNTWQDKPMTDEERAEAKRIESEEAAKHAGEFDHFFAPELTEQNAKEEAESLLNTPKGRSWFSAWERTQNDAAKKQGFANYEHALVATDYKRRRSFR